MVNREHRAFRSGKRRDPLRQTAQLALCLYLSFVSSACSAADRPVNVSLSGTQWQEDLDHLARELPRRHVGPFERVSHEEWNRAVKEFRGSRLHRKRRQFMKLVQLLKLRTQRES